MTHQPPPNTTRRDTDAWASIAIAVAAVAGIFVLIVAGLIAWDYSRRIGADPSETEEFQELKAQLADNPNDESLKEQIRTLDLELREAYFRHRMLASKGAWLLLAGLVVFVASVRTAATLWRKMPSPRIEELPHDMETQWTRIGRWSVVGLAIVLVGLAITLGALVTSPLDTRDLLIAREPGSDETASADSTATSSDGQPAPTSKAEIRPKPDATPETKEPAAKPKEPQVAPKQSSPASVPTASDLPSKEEYAKSWPRFLGPGGRNISALENVPTKWDTVKGENVVWKTPVPLEGNSSPIVWKDHIFLTGATDKKREVYCFSAADGKLLWQKEAPGTPASTAETPKLMEDTGFASCTPATDGRRVYTMFANGDVAAFDFDGNLVWSRSLGIPKNSYGHAASLATWQDRVIVQFDQGSGKETNSKLFALDGKTGSSVWEVPRPVPNSWASPIVIDVKGQEQIVTCADPWVIAYSPADGKEIWRSKTLRQDVGPSPTFADGMVYVANQFPCVAAIRPDGQGDVTETHVAWIGEDGLPDTSSPLATSKFVLLLTSSGTLTCYEAKEGKMLWEQDYESSFKASPAMAGKNVYLLSDEGKVWIVEPGPTGAKTIAEPVMDEGCNASPAFQDGRIYLRGKKHLFCIGK